MKRYNLCNISEDAVIKIDTYGDWVRYEDVEKLFPWMKMEVANMNIFEREGYYGYRCKQLEEELEKCKNEN